MTAIGTTGSVTLLTAIPGSGKTLRTVQWIDQANKRGEQVYVCNVRGLKLPHLPFPDPSKWEEELPAGSTLVVDEAQDFFPAGRTTPNYIFNMSKIRHRGIRLIVVTQQPNYLHSHLLGLVGLHEHLVRLNGREASIIYRKNEIMDKVRSESGRKQYDSETWDFPKEYYGAYDSAEVHTVKYVMPAKTKKGIALAAMCLALLGYLTWSTWRDTVKPAMDASKGGGAALSASADGAAPASSKAQQSGATLKHTATPAEYLEAMRPRVPALPYSAPIFDQRQARSDPKLYCIESGPGLDADGKYGSGRCVCKTEQMTSYDLDQAQCHKFATEGPPYNPYLQSTVERESGFKHREASDQRSVDVASASPSGGAGGSGVSGAASSAIPPPVSPVNVPIGNGVL